MKQHRTVKTALSVCLALALCLGTCGILPSLAAETQIKSWTVSDLLTAAETTGTQNADGQAIFTPESQPIGMQLTSKGYRVAAGDFCIPLYDAGGNPLLYEGDVLRFAAWIWCDDEELSSAHAARLRVVWPDQDGISYNDKSGPDQPNMDTAIISRDNYRKLDEETHSVYGVPYKTVVMEHTMTEDDMTRLDGETYLKGEVAGQGAQYKIYYMMAENATAGLILNESDDFGYASHETDEGRVVTDYKYEAATNQKKLYLEDDETLPTDLVSYTNGFGIRGSRSGAWSTWHADSGRASTLLSLSQELEAGDYRCSFDLNTQLVCDADTPLVTLRAMTQDKNGQPIELGRLDYMAGQSAADKDFISSFAADRAENARNNWGSAYRDVSFSFTVEEAAAVSLEAVVYNNADVRLRSAALYRQINAAEAPGKALAERIAAIGEITPQNCLQKADDITAIQTDLHDYISRYGEDAARFVAGLEDLDTASQTAEEMKAARLAARDALTEKIAELDGVVLDRDTVDTVEPVIAEAERMLQEYLTVYGEDAAADVENSSILTAARQTVDQIRAEPDVTFGDINGDEAINAADALLALQHSVKLIMLTEDQIAAADVNGDTAVNATDALLILQYSVKLIPVFPVEQPNL